MAEDLDGGAAGVPARARHRRAVRALGLLRHRHFPRRASTAPSRKHRDFDHEVAVDVGQVDDQDASDTKGGEPGGHCHHSPSIAVPADRRQGHGLRRSHPPGSPSPSHAAVEPVRRPQRAPSSLTLAAPSRA
ncbi:hypothetical protein ACRAWD_05175 [Caulobacter segnis]